MKYLKIILAISCVSAVCIAKPLPEAVNVHSEKYTLRFVLATVEGKVFESAEGMSELSQENCASNRLESFLYDDKAPPQIPSKTFTTASTMDKANATYTELASLLIDIDKEFSSTNGLLIKGMVGRKIDVATPTPNQDAVMSFEFKYDDHLIKLKEYPLKDGEWSCLAFKSTNKVVYILIKLYEPTK